ncbi:MAG: substrate-binding domain-containing protein [Clostridia bacterium]|nr:substrate-binding domain-containing protein [Clostridia bacterium]
MKKILLKILPLFFVALIIVLCIGVYEYVIDQDNENGNYDNEIQEEIEEQISTNPIFTEDEFPRIDASLATQPLTNAFYENFTGSSSEKIEESYSNTHPAYQKLINGEKDLIVVTEPSEEELKMAEQANVELVVTPVVKEGFVFYINSENPVESLTLDQIQDIYTGKITNWKEVGGTDTTIRAFQRPDNSGSQTGMYSLVMKGKKIMEAPKEDLIETMFEIVNLVSSYDNGLNSIGYSYYYYATTIYDTLDSSVKNRIKFLGIDGIKPSNQTIMDGSYPLNTAYYIVTRKDNTDENVQKLFDAMLSRRGQNVAEETGYVRVK